MAAIKGRPMWRGMKYARSLERIQEESSLPSLPDLSDKISFKVEKVLLGRGAGILFANYPQNTPGFTIASPLESPCHEPCLSHRRADIAAVQALAADITSVMSVVPAEQRQAAAAHLYASIRKRAESNLEPAKSSVGRSGPSFVNYKQLTRDVQLRQRWACLDTCTVAGAEKEDEAPPQRRGKTSPGGIDFALHGSPMVFGLTTMELAASADEAIGKISRSIKGKQSRRPARFRSLVDFLKAMRPKRVLSINKIWSGEAITSRLSTIFHRRFS